jgi:hypothetical protein
MKTLKSMVQFVLEQKETPEYETNEGYWYFLESQKLGYIRQHAELLSQQPNIGMFVPAVCEDGVWRVLEEPEKVSLYELTVGEHSDMITYQQAKSKVLFDGFRLVGYGFEWDKSVFEIENNLYFIEFIGGKVILTISQTTEEITIHTLEDLVKFNLEIK